ncbi:exostosin-1c [Selaginella moellendorffii]|nr:exostosin-1c [Selaginella moellendorffii]|eukprot:XP_002972835.2 exostosin-1c [Selaginella moellendorffii]
MANKPVPLLPAAVMTTLLAVAGIAWTLLSSQRLPSAYNYFKSLSPAVPAATFATFPAGLCNCSVDFGAIGTLSKPHVECQCSGANSTAPDPIETKVVHAEVEKPCPKQPTVVKYEPWWAEGKTWHYPAKFPRCSMDACFNFSRCSNMDNLMVFTYEDHNAPVRYFTKLNETRWHTKDPEKACIFMVFLDTSSPWQKQPRDLPHWNNGLNHALVTFADKWSQRAVAEESIGLASLIVSEAHETIFRPGFDISIPLPPFYHFHEFQNLKPFERKYFLTFKGLRYIGRGEGLLRSFDSFRNLHNGADIVVVTSCKHFVNDLKRKENSSLGVHCDEDENLYSQYSSFSDLMNTTFGLVPAGVQPNSYRFGEVLSAGAIPILIVDNYVKPFSNLATWYQCLLQFPSTEIHLIVAALRAMSTAHVEKRQHACSKIYSRHFQSDLTLLESTIAALEERFLGAFPAFSSHLSDLNL